MGTGKLDSHDPVRARVAVLDEARTAETGPAALADDPMDIARAALAARPDPAYRLLRRLVAIWLAVLCTVGQSAMAATPAKILVLSRGPERPSASVVEAIRIHLARHAVVEVGPSLDQPTLRERSRQAALLKRRANATMVVWLERQRGPEATESVAVLYLLSDQPQVEQKGIVAPPGAPEDRTVALLVRESLEGLHAAREDPPIRRPRRAEAARSDEPADAESSWGWMVDVGFLVASGAASPGTQTGLSSAVGARWQAPGFRAELCAGARLVTGLVTEKPEGYLEAYELPLLVSSRLLFVTEHVAIGGLAEPALRLLFVEGRTPQGVSGSSFRVVPTVLTGLELRFKVHPWLQLRAGGGIELTLRRQRFAINEVPLLDLGRVRGLGQLSVVVSPP